MGKSGRGGSGEKKKSISREDLTCQRIDQRDESREEGREKVKERKEDIGEEKDGTGG